MKKLLNDSIVVAGYLTIMAVFDLAPNAGHVIGWWIMVVLVLLLCTVNWHKVKIDVQRRIWAKHLLREHKATLKASVDKELKDERTSNPIKAPNEDKQKS